MHLKKQEKNERLLLKIILLLVMLKMVFVGSNSDEGYAIELCYRLAKGDLLITQMWEPHQTSAIFGAILMRLYWVFTGGSSTGSVLFFHICGVICQLSVAYFLYHVVKKELPEKLAFYLAIIYALCWPKGVIAPEYSNLQNWFLTCMVLCLVLAKEKAWCYCYAGFFLACLVLAYPSMIILYPVVLLLIWKETDEEISKRSKWKATWCITGVCACVAVAFIGYLFSYADVYELSQGIKYILQDGSHSEGMAIRMGENLYYALEMLLRIGIYIVIAVLWCRFSKRHYNKRDILLITLTISFGVQVLYWLFRDEFVNQPQAEIVIMAIMGIVLLKKQSCSSSKYMIVCSVTGLIGTMILSNFKFTELVVYLSLASIGGVILWYQQTDLEETDESKETCKKPIILRLRMIMIIWIITLSFGRVWVTSQGGEMHTTPFEVRNVQKSGAGIGIFTDYMTGHRYNTVASQWDELVNEGDAVLYVGPTSCYYMFGDNIISAPNTISTPTYDELIFEYWEMFPERYPDVVLVESCYGESVYESDSFIIKWLDTQYQATEVLEKEYVRVYRK